MSMITKCPECRTRFKVTDEHLAAHDGLVRCGRCNEVFNARENLYSDEPSPQLSLPIDIAPETSAPVSSAPENETVTKQTTDLEGQVSPQEHLHLIGETHQIDDAPELNPELLDANTAPALVNQIPSTHIDEVTVVEDNPLQQTLFYETPTDTPKKTNWGGIAAASALSLALVAQSLYFFRVEIAAHLPGLKPLLVQACSAIHCTVDLPREIELLSIESSELEADPNQAALVTLHALLHNRANYTQAFPNLELTLTDTQDQIVARRVFRPQEYLKTADDSLKGLLANREVEVSLHLDTADLKASGYRLFLFYPK